MSDLVSKLPERIRSELRELRRLVRRAQEAWNRAERTGDDLYLDSVALNLHAFYDGLEGLFEAISKRIDGAAPGGPNWHAALLNLMAAETPKLRPAVISETTRAALDPYRSFRHVVRHVYPFRFEAQRLRPLVKEAGPVFERIEREMLAFAAFLQARADDHDDRNETGR